MIEQQGASAVGESHLYAELRTFPLRLAELTDLREESYTLALSSKPYDRDRISRGTKFCSASSVERVVVRILSHPYFLELQTLVACISCLYDGATPADKKLLRRFWRGESLSCPFPTRLLYRYQSLKEEWHVTTVALEEAEQARRNAETAA